eukprot:TRINITY_DN381_c0_g2_i1.p1 TRINITY_DN381_c0_g2~~TRINITY_DN381_c0_g2_i1.p1  ORF type:complete len:355 (-),score=47.53 TRINITY_DN381_c0_g2_i1:204-1268(-)
MLRLLLVSFLLFAVIPTTVVGQRCYDDSGNPRNFAASGNVTFVPATGCTKDTCALLKIASFSAIMLPSFTTNFSIKVDGQEEVVMGCFTNNSENPKPFPDFYALVPLNTPVALFLKSYQKEFMETVIHWRDILPSNLSLSSGPYQYSYMSWDCAAGFWSYCKSANFTASILPLSDTSSYPSYASPSTPTPDLFPKPTYSIIKTRANCTSTTCKILTIHSLTYWERRRTSNGRAMALVWTNTKDNATGYIELSTTFPGGSHITFNFGPMYVEVANDWRLRLRANSEYFAVSPITFYAYPLKDTTQLDEVYDHLDFEESAHSAYNQVAPLLFKSPSPPPPFSFFVCQGLDLFASSK